MMAHRRASKSGFTTSSWRRRQPCTPGRASPALARCGDAWRFHAFSDAGALRAAASSSADCDSESSSSECECDGRRQVPRSTKLSAARAGRELNFFWLGPIAVTPANFCFSSLFLSKNTDYNTNTNLTKKHFENANTCTMYRYVLCIPVRICFSSLWLESKAYIVRKEFIVCVLFSKSLNAEFR